MANRRTWSEIRETEEFRGRWVALDECRYDAKTAQPVEGSVVDSDEDLVSLCSRMQANSQRHCAVLFCDAHHSEAPPPSRRISRAPDRSVH